MPGRPVRLQSCTYARRAAIAHQVDAESALGWCVAPINWLAQAVAQKTNLEFQHKDQRNAGAERWSQRAQQMRCIVSNILLSNSGQRNVTMSVKGAYDVTPVLSSVSV